MAKNQAETPGMKLCRHCKTEIPQAAKVCPNCRKKQGRKGLIALLVIVILIIIIIIAAASGDSEDTGTSQTGEPQVTESTTQSSSGDTASKEAGKEKKTKPKKISEKDYKKACQKVTYEDLARNPDNFAGKKIRMDGKIMQVQESGGSAVYLIQVTKDEYDLWDDIVWVNAQVDSNNRFLEDDVVRIWGEYQGIREYETVLSSQNSVPEINARYLAVVKEES